MISTYTVPTQKREEIEKAFARFQKKAAEYAKTVSLSFGEPYAKECKLYERIVAERGNIEEACVGSIMVEVIDLTIDSEVIMKDGYTVAARIEHLDGGNVVSVYDGDFNPAWSTVAAKCEHCGGKHGQKVTLIVRHQNGTEKQVGRTCLKDYCGIDPQRIGILNQLCDIILNDDVEHCAFEKNDAGCVFKTTDVLAAAIQAIKAQGYRKVGEPYSNKDVVCAMLDNGSDDYKSSIEEAEAMIKGIKEMDTVRDSLMTNFKTLAVCGYCKTSHFGIMAYVPIAYRKHLEREAEQERKDAKTNSEREASEYVGDVGQRIEVMIQEMKLLTSWETQYGTTYLYKFIDSEGNVFVWFASHCIAHCTRIKATVKEHAERDGVKQTVLTRCKAV